MTDWAEQVPGPIEVSYVLAAEHERVELAHEVLYAAVEQLWRAHQARVEDLCRGVYEATAPEYRDRLLLITDARAPADQLPWAACWTFPEVAHCVSGLWPDCGSIPCGYPCARGPVLP